MYHIRDFTGLSGSQAQDRGGQDKRPRKSKWPSSRPSSKPRRHRERPRRPDGPRSTPPRPRRSHPHKPSADASKESPAKEDDSSPRARHSAVAPGSLFGRHGAGLSFCYVLPPRHVVRRFHQWYQVVFLSLKVVLLQYNVEYCPPSPVPTVELITERTYSRKTKLRIALRWR